MASASAAWADEPTAEQPVAAESQPAEQSLATVQDGKWHLATIGYVFAAGAYGKTTPRDPLPAVDVDLSFRDVLHSFKFAFMGAAEARKDRFVILGDLMWVHLGEDQGLKVRDRSFANVEIDSKTTAITALGGYRVLNSEPFTLDLLAGARLNGNKQKLDYSGTLIDVSAKVSKTWVDPVFATRASVPLGGKMNLALYGDMGGFGLGSDLTWQAMGTVNYQISRKMNVGLGWRYFKLNFDDKDGFVYNVAQSGPIITLRSDF
jgi:hypothetical protein